jgi:hypothetical protein
MGLHLLKEFLALQYSPFIVDDRSVLILDKWNVRVVKDLFDYVELYVNEEFLAPEI